MKKKQIIIEINDYSDLDKEQLEEKLMALSMKIMLAQDSGDLEEAVKLFLEVNEITKLLEGDEQVWIN